MERHLNYAKAILEATDQCLADDPAVYLMGLGVPDPRGIFGTTIGLANKHGHDRVMDMPVSENGMTGIAIGSAIAGMRPIMTHQRIDFMLLAMDQIINNAAKWHYMFNGTMKVPLVIRLIIGQGWGQGPQHSQSLQSVFTHIPGLKVVMPATPYDAKGLLIAAVRDDNPVIYIEHRWLHGITGHVPEEMYATPIGRARIVKQGKDMTIITSSYMTIESLKAAEILARQDISVEVVDLRTLKPLDNKTIVESVEKTGKCLVVDGAWRTSGFSAEILATVAEEAFSSLSCPPRRLAFPDIPSPTSCALAPHFFVKACDIVNSVRKMSGLPEQTAEEMGISCDIPLDVPDKSFTGPF